MTERDRLTAATLGPNSAYFTSQVEPLSQKRTSRYDGPKVPLLKKLEPGLKLEMQLKIKD